jgi:LAO/AO transport system kinase
MIALGDSGSGNGWKTPIVSTVATTGEGIDELTGKIDAHWAWLSSSGEREQGRQGRAREEVAAIAVAALRRRMTRLPGPGGLDELAGLVAEGELDAYTAADRLVGALVTGGEPETAGEPDGGGASSPGSPEVS